MTYLWLSLCGINVKDGAHCATKPHHEVEAWSYVSATNTQANNRALHSYDLSQYERINYEKVYIEMDECRGGKNLPAEDHRNCIVLKLRETICIYYVLGTFLKV